MTITVIFISYALAALAFLVAGGMLLAGRSAQHRYKTLLVMACLVTAAWAGSVAVGQISSTAGMSIASVVLEQLRSLAWMAAVAFVLFIAYRKRIDNTVAALTAGAVVLAVGYIFTLAIYGAFAGVLPETAVKVTFIARIVIAVAGLLLVENLFRNSGAEARWAVKYLCFGAGIIFMYDFYVYAEAALFGGIDPETYSARGLVDAIAVPFIVLAAARSQSWPIDLHVSREVVFRSATLLAAGGYLILMSMVSFSLQALDSAWGAVSQSVFLVSAALLLAMFLSSGKVQARAKDFINRNFFSYKYDYRKEWLQFISAVSDSSTDLKMPDRAVRALANIVGSTGGVIWTRRDDAYRIAASFNMGANLPAIEKDHPFVAHLAALPGVRVLRTGEVDGVPTTIVAPQWLREHNRAWLVLPLLHTDGLAGIALLGDPRAEVELSWEDFELLKTAGRQAASYIAEAETAQSLAQARRFEDFNRQFAFVVHDIKNLAGQMSLMVKNAERYGDNPEFQKDMLRTVGHCATRMRTLLEQIKSRTAAPAPAPNVKFELMARLARVAATWRLQIPRLRAELPTSPIEVQGDPERLDTVLNHLLQNALDAAGPQADIAIEFHTESASGDDGASTGKWAVVTVSDNGPGMDRSFIETKLFQPLTSVKSTGFGIGAYQTRQMIREMGGRLEVESQVGQGTRMMMYLPQQAVTATPVLPPQDEIPQLRASNG